MVLMAILRAWKQSHTFKSTGELSWEPGPRSSISEYFLPNSVGNERSFSRQKPVLLRTSMPSVSVALRTTCCSRRERIYLLLGLLLAHDFLGRRMFSNIPSTVQSPHSRMAFSLQVTWQLRTATKDRSHEESCSWCQLHALLAERLQLWTSL